MTGKAGLKAGLIGAAVMVGYSLINNVLLPVTDNIAISLVMCGISMALYAGIGVLAGFFVAAPRTPGQAAGAGAIAGLISGLIAGVLGYVLVATGVASVVDSPQWQQAIEQGIDPTISVVIGAACNPILGTGMAAIGGAIIGGVKPD